MVALRQASGTIGYAALGRTFPRSRLRENPWPAAKRAYVAFPDPVPPVGGGPLCGIATVTPAMTAVVTLLPVFAGSARVEVCCE